MGSTRQNRAGRDAQDDALVDRRRIHHGSFVTDVRACIVVETQDGTVVELAITS